MSNYTVISFYTQDWEYPRYAAKLAADCQRLGIDHLIEELPSSNDYLKNCNKKPGFILNKLQKIKRPVLWMDADGTICDRLDALDDPDIMRYDIAGNVATWDHDKIHVGSLWFNFTQAAIDVLTKWKSHLEIADYDDDVGFNRVLDSCKDSTKIFALPQEYFLISRSLTGEVPLGTKIVHRLSTGPSKESYKQYLAGRINAL